MYIESKPGQNNCWNIIICYGRKSVLNKSRICRIWTQPDPLKGPNLTAQSQCKSCEIARISDVTINPAASHIWRLLTKKCFAYIVIKKNPKK